MRRILVAGLCLVAMFVTGAAAAGSALATSSSGVAWGGNAQGQLGDGTTTNSSAPVAVSGVTGVAAVSAGGEHSLALLSNGTVTAWGDNGFGQLGNGTTTSSAVPVAVSGLSSVTAVSAGGKHSLALLSNGTVMAWGNNANGQLGNGTITASDVPVAVTGLSEVVAISAGASFSLALLKSGAVMGWGDDTQGQLGNGTTTNGELTPVAVSGLTGVTAIAAGGAHSLALLGGGSVMAWGDNKFGQLGNATNTSSNVPVAVSGITTATAISAGSIHSLARLSTGTAVAWGGNGRGQLGNGTTTSSNVPVSVSGLTEAAAISAGSHHSLALLSNGTAVAWGENAAGQLGNGNNTSSDVPVAVNGVSALKAISAGGLHSLAIGPSLPTVTNVNPRTGPASGGTTVTITGIGFAEVTGVKFGTTNATKFSVESTTTIIATSPAGTGIADVTVTTPGGASAPSARSEFSYLPAVTGLTPSTGTQGGGTLVTITGVNFNEVTAVKFGTTSATKYVVESPTMITAQSPAGAGAVDVTVTTAGGTSVASSADHFTYGGAPPEFGQCIKAAKGAGVYTDSGCTTAGTSANYTWVPGPGPNAKFKTKTKGRVTFTSQTVGAKTITCKAEKGTGTTVGPKVVGGVVMTFSGCASGTGKCSSAGAKAGSVSTTALVGELGVIRTSTEGPIGNAIGLDLKAASGGALAEFTCGSATVSWRGSVIVEVSTNGMRTTSNLHYLAEGGKQQPESFEGQPRDVIETSVNGGAFEQTGWSDKIVQTSKEAIEVNSVV